MSAINIYVVGCIDTVETVGARGGRYLPAIDIYVVYIDTGVGGARYVKITGTRALSVNIERTIKEYAVTVAVYRERCAVGKNQGRVAGKFELPINRNVA